MRLIFRYLRPYLWLTLLAPLLMLLEVFMDLLQPTLMATIVDQGIADGNMPLVLTTGLRMFVVAGIGLVGGIGCGIVATRVSTSLGADLRNDLFTRIQNLSFSDRDKLETGNLITILTGDVTQLENITRMLLRIMMRAPLQVIGSLVMAISISPLLSLVLVLLIPLLVVTLWIIIRRVYPLFNNVQTLIDRLNTLVRENLTAKRLIKAFVREEFEEKKFAAENGVLVGKMTRASTIAALIHPTMQWMLHLGMVVALWAGGLLVRDAGFQVGRLLAFIQYLNQILWSLIMVGNLLMRLARALVSSARVQVVLGLESSIIEQHDCLALKEIGQGLEFRQVVFTYDGEKNEPAIEGISFSLAPGQTLGIIGATGSGKTTLANLIPRFYDVNSGAIYIDGRDIRDYSLNSLRRSIGIVMQDPQLFRGSIRSNILYGYVEPGCMGEQQAQRATSPGCMPSGFTLASQDVRGEQQAQRAISPAEEEVLQRAADAARIAEFIASLPGGYDADLNQRGLNLSGGQKQRIAIARALAVNPQILILDDATSAVDTLTEKSIRFALEQQHSRLITVIIAQRLDSIIGADQILVLEQGRQAALGSHSQLLETSTLYRAIYTSQFGKEGEDGP